MMAINVCL